MRDIFSAPGLDRLRQLVRRRALLAFDFDGTLAPIVPHPQDAFVPPRTMSLLSDLQSWFPLAIISGRSATDVRSRLHGVGVHVVIGNHGIEPSPFMTQAAESVERWGPALEEHVRHVPGVMVESKKYSMAIHYREAVTWGIAEPALAAIRDAIAVIPESVRLLEGHCVANVLPHGAPDKGEALRRTQRHYRAEATLYVGDDVTDEDAFRAQDHEASVGIRVGRHRASAAPFYIKNQLDIDYLLERLLAECAAAAGSSPSPSPSPESR